MAQLPSRAFCIWLRGVLDVTGGDVTDKTFTLVKNKLDTVFIHEEEPTKTDKDKSKLEAPRC